MPKYKGYDFCGWATRNDLRCSDGRTIRKDAFAHQDGAKVPLVWGHNHDTPEAVLGHGFLENRPEGVFFYGYFNDSDLAQAAKQDVVHGDITSLSIWANHLKEKAGDVLHGSIKEVSLVLAGANVGAQITYPVVVHGEDTETIMDEAYIYVGEEYGLEFGHEDAEKDDGKEKENGEMEKEDRTVQDVLDTMNEEQLQVLSYLVAKAAEEAVNASVEEEEEVEVEVEHEDSGGEEVSHSEEETKEEPKEETKEEEKQEPEEEKERTVQDVLDEMTDEQRKVVEYLVATAAAEGLGDEEEIKEDGKEEIEHSDRGGNTMNFNAFEGATKKKGAYLSHSDEEDIISVAKKYGSFRQAMEAFAEERALAHDDEPAAEEEEEVTLAPVSHFTSYPDGNTPAAVDALFPEYRNVGRIPDLVVNDQTWVKAVLNKVHKSPFSRIRTCSVDVREIEEIRARGYAKGKEKVLAGNYAAAKRATDPQTVYVKSALNRDDIIDITDFDYVDYQYKVDRMQLEMELARAILIGDGRDDASPDKISPDHIRPIWGDNSLYTITKQLTLAQGTDFGTNYLYADAMEEALLDAKIDYRGTGAADMFCSQEFFNKLLLAKDLMGHRLYKDKNELAAALDVANIYTVPAFANKTRTADNHTYKLLAIIGNLGDYALGATKGGEITHFTQFDIDFNQEKSLLETRCSGAITKVDSFIVIEEQTQ